MKNTKKDCSNYEYDTSCVYFEDRICTISDDDYSTVVHFVIIISYYTKAFDQS